MTLIYTSLVAVMEVKIGSIMYQDRFYENDGKGNFTENKKDFPPFLKNVSCVKSVDFDHDGDLYLLWADGLN